MIRLHVRIRNMSNDIRKRALKELEDKNISQDDFVSVCEALNTIERIAQVSKEKGEVKANEGSESISNQIE